MIENKKPKSIEEYILAALPAVQEKLWQMHDTIQQAAPGAAESIKWNMPAYSYKKILVAFAIFKNHIGFFPMGAPLKAFENELKNYKVSKVAVQFALNEPLPVSLIKKIVAFRVKEDEAGTIQWRS